MTTILKFGRLKAYSLEGLSQECIDALNEYHKLEEQNDLKWIEALCQFIDLLPEDRQIYLWFDGEYVSKDQAKKYVREYKR